MITTTSIILSSFYHFCYSQPIFFSDYHTHLVLDEPFSHQVCVCLGSFFLKNKEKIEVVHCTFHYNISMTMRFFLLRAKKKQHEIG